MLKKTLVSIIFIIFSSNNTLLFSKDIPIIVIAPSKKPQSASTVGTSVVVLDEEFLKNSNEYFLGDVLSGGTTSANFFQNGGHGSTSAIQLRGLPKRYSTVYIDGVKMSDPSSVSGDFDFNHILTSQISRVEILKGNQSSVYGSGAIGGTINITTKKGKPGTQKNTMINTGSHGTVNYSASYSGSDDINNYYVGFERFQTKGLSAMTHNDEKDGYKNNSLVANYSRKLPNNLQLMTVHSLQSVAFNKTIKSRIDNGVAISTPIIGDIVGRIDDNRQLEPASMVTVEDRTLERISRNCQLGRLAVTAQLPGSQMMQPSGEFALIEKSVIEEMGLKDTTWEVEKIARLTTKGTRRPMVTNFSEFQYEPVPIAGEETMGDKWNAGVTDGELWHPEGACIRFRFTLPSGSYATTLLREFMRSPLKQL